MPITYSSSRPTAVLVLSSPFLPVDAQVSGAGAPQVRRAPTQAMRMRKAWPVLASA